MVTCRVAWWWVGTIRASRVEQGDAKTKARGKAETETCDMKLSIYFSGGRGLQYGDLRGNTPLPEALARGSYENTPTHHVKDIEKIKTHKIKTGETIEKLLTNHRGFCGASPLRSSGPGPAGNAPVRHGRAVRGGGAGAPGGVPGCPTSDGRIKHFSFSRPRKQLRPRQLWMAIPILDTKIL